MPEPHWTSYVGMIGGVVGAVTGIAGAVVAGKSYRRVNQIKALDLRVELRKDWNEADELRGGIEKFVAKVNGSHERVLSSHSGATEAWKDEFAVDLRNLRFHLTAAPRIDSSIDTMTPQQLELKLDEVHKFSTILKTTKSKYEGIWESDEEARRERRQDMKAMVDRSFR